MVNIRDTENPRGSLAETVQRLLDRGYDAEARSVIEAAARTTSTGIVAQRLEELEAEAARLREVGERLRPDNVVLRGLLADLGDELAGVSRLVDGAAEQLQGGAVDAAGVIQRQMAVGGATDAQLARIGIRWASPDPESVVDLVRLVNSSAWSEMLNREFVGLAIDTVNNQAIRGIALGWSPLRTARAIRRISEGFPAAQANNLMRTLQLTAYRDGGAVHQNANVGIIEQVIRIAALSMRTCLACVAQHGDVIWDSSRNEGSAIPRVNDHHQGRCTSVVRVQGREVNIRSGQDWYDSLDDGEQRELAGAANYNALSDGAVNLRDYISPYDDRVFGEMIRESSLRGILGDGANQFYGG